MKLDADIIGAHQNAADSTMYLYEKIVEKLNKEHQDENFATKNPTLVGLLVQAAAIRMNKIAKDGIVDGYKD